MRGCSIGSALPRIDVAIGGYAVTSSTRRATGARTIGQNDGITYLRCNWPVADWRLPSGKEAIAAGRASTISNHSPLAIYYPIAVIAGTMMILPRRILIGLALMGAVGALAAFVWRWDHRHHVGTMLNLEKLPQSIRRVDCASFGVTDVLERCSFEVEPNDFPILLSGYKFEVPQVCRTGRSGLCVDKTDAGMAHDYCCGPKTGENFHIATIHIATPRDAPHGGTLTILTDASKRRAIVDLYVE